MFYRKYRRELKGNPKLLHDIICMISPVELARNNIKVLKTIQRPGEIILTIGATFHAGFSHGKGLCRDG